MARIVGLFQKRGGDANYIHVVLYLACLGASNIGLEGILRALSKAHKNIGNLSNLFRGALILMTRWGYNQNGALTYIVKNSPEKNLSDLIRRLDYAIKVGLPISSFSRIELRKFFAFSGNEFEKSLEKLRRIVEAYITLLSTISLLVVSFLLVSIVFGGSDPRHILNIAAVSVFLTLSSTSLLFITTNLRRRLFIRGPRRPPSLALLEKLTKPLLLTSILVMASKAAFPWDSLAGSQFTVFILCTLGGLPCFMHGLAGRRWHRRVHSHEEAMTVVLRSLGDYTSVTGSLRSASKLMLMSDFGPFNKLLKNLEVRLRAGIGQATALTLLGVETLSDIGHRMFQIMGDLLEAGGKPSATVDILTDFLSDQLMKDKRRQQVTASLKALTIPLQATLAAILALMATLLQIIWEIASLIEARIRLISPIDPRLAADYFYVMLAGVAAVTSANIYLSDGDSEFTITFYFGILTLVAGVTYLVMSLISYEILSSFSGLSRSLSTLSEVG